MNKILNNLKVVFLGTPEFAVPSLKALIEAGIVIPLIITQPDKPAGRGQKIIESPIKKLALENKLEISQPEKIRNDRNLIDKLKEIQPDLMVTAAFGQIISEEIIEIPKWGIWNVHASLLPRWRGAAPINWAILENDKETGITIMQTEKGLDTGAIISKASISITESDNAETLTKKLAELGAKLLIETITKNYHEKITPQIQNEALATHAPKLNKSMGIIDWQTFTAQEIMSRLKALTPWPGLSFTISNGSIIKLIEAETSLEYATEKSAGTILEIRPDSFLIKCKENCLEVKAVKPESKGKMNAAAWLRGLRLKEGNLLETKLS